jgi:hypothetical protein
MCVAIAVETFKIIHKQSPSYLHDLISIKDQKYNFRHQDIAVFSYNIDSDGVKLDIWDQYIFSQCKDVVMLVFFT